MRDVIAMILAGGRVEELSVLTAQRPKAAVPFAGQYRIIDFALSGLMRADIERVGVLSLYRPWALIDHLGTGEPWDLIGRGRGVKLLPPYTGHAGGFGYRGTADAVWQNLNFIRDHAPRDVLILSGDHIYNVDFTGLIEQHRRTAADLTMVVKEMEPDRGRGRFGFAEVDGDGRVTGYEEKPAEPRSRLVSLTVFLFRTEVLVRRLSDAMRRPETYQLYADVLPAMVGRDSVQAFLYDGYWNYARSVDAYHQAHRDLLGETPPIALADWAVRTRKSLLGLGDPPPVRLESGGRCARSLVAPGAHVAGEVDGSVLSPGVSVEPGARVTDSVLLDGVRVCAGARVDRAILDKRVEVGAGARIGCGEPAGPNRAQPRALAGGTSLIGKDARLPADCTVGRNCVVAPGTGEGDWSTGALASGDSLEGAEGGPA